MSRTSNYKFNSIKLCFFKLKKNISEHFWRIFQILICDLVWVVNVVNIQKMRFEPKYLFFQIFSQDSYISCHFTLSQNWICKNISRIKKFWIYTPNFKIQITVPRVPSVSQRSDLGRWPSNTFLFVSSRSTKWATETSCLLEY